MPELSLFQRAIDRREFGIQLGADALNSSDDRERDSASDQAIFDCRRAGIVGEECSNRFHVLVIPAAL
jgi:hypothetical protein